MPLFQKSVLNKYLQDLNKEQVNIAYSKFVVNFANTEKQNNIRLAKEEQYQEGFLRELFVDVFGYTINPHVNYNLTTEYKNEKDAKKADGALLKDNKPIAIIELKGTETVDLKSVEQQAFNYKNNQSACKYIITSNFEKLRFYIENAIEFIEFDLFHLSKEDFELMYLCLFKDNLLNDLPLKINQASVVQEENITKKLYSDYSAFKHELFTNIVALNPQYDKLLLYKKTQKLLDRLLFIFFAEDRLLLPPNSIREITKQWEQLKELDSYTPLYKRFKMYFHYLDIGHKGKEYDIFAYNGGLFETDEILDNISIDDEILFTHTIKLSDYDYETDVDVNILGHIFEHSLNEMEEVQAEIQGQAVEKNKTKRKKDGIFYTPKYITKYIVDSTLGALCTEKKTELGINEDEVGYAKRKEKRKELIEKLDTYRQWLLTLTICDPACGSGAFLNQALNYLIDEHKIIDELQAQVTGSSIVFSDIENTILENNLYGVDLNDESVEIARLSLWLRTAQKGRKLTSLNENIKCGNSLIDDPAVAGDKAFNWQNEFPEVFANGGFDVVIGNPPYLVIKGGRWISGFEYDEKSITFIKNRFKTAEQQINTYVLFLELSKHLAKFNGIISQITPNTFFANEYSKKIRNFLIEEANLIEIKNTGLVFNDASVETAITTYRNNKYESKTIIINSDYQFKINFLDIRKLTEDNKYLINISKKSIGLLLKLNNNEKINSIAKVWRGLTTGDDKIFLSDCKQSEIYKPILTGSEIQRYYYDKVKKYVYYDAKLLDRARDERIFILKEKLISKFVGNRLTFCYDNEQNYVINTGCSFELLDTNFSIKYLLCLLNSKLLNYYFQMIFSDSRTTFPIMKSGCIEQLPTIKNSFPEQKPLIEKADIMLSQNKELQGIKTKFIKLLQSKYSELKTTNKLQNWAELEFAAFAKELEKQKVKLSLSDQAEWLDYFEKEKAKAQAIKKVIDDTDKEIDKMVYELYGLTDEEIRIVEGN